MEIWTGVTDAWLTDWLTTLKDRATQLLIEYKSGALITHYCYRPTEKQHLFKTPAVLNCSIGRDILSLALMDTSDFLTTFPLLLLWALMSEIHLMSYLMQQRLSFRMIWGLSICPFFEIRKSIECPPAHSNVGHHHHSGRQLPPKEPPHTWSSESILGTWLW